MPQRTPGDTPALTDEQEAKLFAQACIQLGIAILEKRAQEAAQEQKQAS